MDYRWYAETRLEYSDVKSVFLSAFPVLSFRTNWVTLLCMRPPGRDIPTLWKCCWKRVSGESCSTADLCCFMAGKLQRGFPRQMFSFNVRFCAHVCFRPTNGPPEQWEQAGCGHGDQRALCLASQKGAGRQWVQQTLGGSIASRTRRWFYYWA